MAAGQEAERDSLPSSGPPQGLPRGAWMALIAALLGWMFDGFEMGLFPLIGQPALKDLLAGTGAQDADINRWFSVIIAVFLVGAATGGVLFGWLGDRIGRVRAMSLSIVTYAVFTGLCGLATEAWQIAVLRFIASLGMGGEWSLGVALVNEIWPDRSRALLAGLIGAAANVGFLLVGLISLALHQLVEQVRGVLLTTGLPEDWVHHLLKNDGWRFLMIVGALPALLVFLIRLCVPESERWQAQKARGATSHWANRDLLGVLVGTLGAGSVILIWSPVVKPLLALGSADLLVRAAASVPGLVIAMVGFLYPVLRYLRRAESAGDVAARSFQKNLGRLLLGAGLAGVALLGTWGALQWAPRWAIDLAKGTGYTHAKEYTQISSAAGAIVGTIVAALLAGWFGRRITYTAICLGSLAAACFLYQANREFGPLFVASVFMAGGVTAAFYGWFPLYLPELFPTSIRATSQGFAYNFGRVIAAIGTLQTATLMGLFGNSFAMAGTVLSAIYLIGVALIWLAPETRGKPLPE